MSVEYILEKLEEETRKPDFRKNVIVDYSSDGETASVWYSTFTPEDFEDEELSGDFPEPEGEKWEEALTNYINDAWDNFANRFSNIAKVEDGKLAIYRMIKVESLPKFIYFLQKGKPIRGYSGIGIFWSWDKDKAEAHWGHGKYNKHTILLKGLVNINDINFKSTAKQNLNPSIGEDEAEIRIKEKSPIWIKNVYSNEGKEIWKGEVKLAASFKAKVLAKYRIKI